jgi:hypothetical protein
MADTELRVESASLNFASKISERIFSPFLFCEELRPELHKAKLAISSYEKILNCYSKKEVIKDFVPRPTR